MIDKNNYSHVTQLASLKPHIKHNIRWLITSNASAIKDISYVLNCWAKNNQNKLFIYDPQLGSNYLITKINGDPLNETIISLDKIGCINYSLLPVGKNKLVINVQSGIPIVELQRALEHKKLILKNNQLNYIVYT